MTSERQEVDSTRGAWEIRCAASEILGARDALKSQLMGEHSFEELLTREALLAAAGDKYFARGEDYFEQELVERLRVLQGAITAKVQGTETVSAARESCLRLSGCSKSGSPTASRSV